MNETIQSIIEWHTKTFPDATYDGQFLKFDDECKEYMEANTQAHRLEELADMFIVACGLARFSKAVAMQKFAIIADIICQLNNEINIFRFEVAVNTKMAENRKRKWNKQDGKYQHVEAK